MRQERKGQEQKERKPEEYLWDKEKYDFKTQTKIRQTLSHLTSLCILVILTYLCKLLHLICCQFQLISVFFLFFVFSPCRRACGILAYQPGLETVPPSVEAQGLNHWTAREVPIPGIGNREQTCAVSIQNMSNRIWTYGPIWSNMLCPYRICPIEYAVSIPHSKGYLSFPTRDQSQAPHIGSAAP